MFKIFRISVYVHKIKPHSNVKGLGLLVLHKIFKVLAYRSLCKNYLSVEKVMVNQKLSFFFKFYWFMSPELHTKPKVIDLWF